jgi:hypothetical protein
MAHDEFRLTTTALAALSEIDGLTCGPLSPLARITRPQGPADPASLIAMLEGLDADRRACIPALIDPRQTLALIVADRERHVLGQFVWTGVHTDAPGFRVDVDAEGMNLSDPLTMDEVELSLKDRLAFAGVAEVPPARYTMTGDEAWTILALIDTYGTAAALREAARATGFPPGVSLGDITASWEAGLARPNPGWAVSLAGLVAPEHVPEGFPGRIGDILPGMQAADLVVLLEGEAGDALGTVCMLGEGLELLCRGLSGGGLGFGVVRSVRVAPDRVEVARLTGWRTARGIVLLDLSTIGAGRAELMIVGPSHANELLGDLLGTAEPTMPPEDQHLGSPLTVDALLGLLRPAVPAPANAGHESLATCPHCGKPVRTDARFCGKCGQSLRS